jgi:hypothetical protein
MHHQLAKPRVDDSTTACRLITRSFQESLLCLLRKKRQVAQRSRGYQFPSSQWSGSRVSSATMPCGRAPWRAPEWTLTEETILANQALGPMCCPSRPGQLRLGKLIREAGSRRSAVSCPLPRQWRWRTQKSGQKQQKSTAYPPTVRLLTMTPSSLEVPAGRCSGVSPSKMTRTGWPSPHLKSPPESTACAKLLRLPMPAPEANRHSLPSRPPPEKFKKKLRVLDTAQGKKTN